MNFTYHLDILTLLLPPICFGIVAGGFLLYLYMYMQYNSKLYLAVVINAFFCMMFTFSETSILVWGGIFHNTSIGRQFDRLEQISALFLFFAIPYFISYLLKLNKNWAKINRYIAYAGLITACVITAVSYIYPGSLVSQTEPTLTYKTFEADYGRGLPGPLYNLRDLIMGALIIYVMICMITDLIWHKMIGYIIFSFTGVALALYAAFDDMLFLYTNFNIDPLSGITFSRGSVGITLYITLSMAGQTRLFVGSMKEAEKAGKIISLSERKYRLIVEGTKDFIFSLNHELQFISVNESMHKMMNMNIEKIKTMTFPDLVFDNPGDYGLTGKIIKSNLDSLIMEKKQFDYKVMFKPFTSNEPKEFRVRLEYINIDEEEEIVGRATPVVDDILLDCFHSEVQKYVIGNYLVTADEMSTRLVRNLSRYMKAQDVSYLRVCLREIIINAIEHGNLEISFEEKTRVLNNENYMEYILNKQTDPSFRGKKVTIEYSINPNKAVFKITDQGKGFNYKELLDKVQNEVKDKLLPHGRGITMTMNVFDKIKYNETGNEVILVKYFG